MREDGKFEFPLCGMRLVKENVKQFSRAKTITWSENYIVCSTGRQIKIFDKELKLLQIIRNVQYVYKCIISPDEKKLLLVSITNSFYIVELSTFSITKHTIKGKYSDNLEGRGCWSLNGKDCCFCVGSKQSVRSALRIYDDIQNGAYQDFLCDKYWLTSIIVIPKYKKYLLTGYNQESDKGYLIWYDGKVFEEYPICGSERIGAPICAKYDESTDSCTVIGTDGAIFCNTDGTSIKEFTLPDTNKQTFSFIDVFKAETMEEGKYKEITDITDILVQCDLKELFIPDIVVDISCSKSGKYYFVATLKGMLCINAETYAIEAEKEYSHGVRNIEEICENLLLVTTWDSIDLIRIVFE